ncbi:hypothetical protein JVT61DRAFT_8486 [Boletus reticuloceps]|uniref:DUF6532 domain-containing protein n=1 Tax=Boletus reticuloceps TaxID=495285 RepID=A0A8I3AEH7_9AGAM|nr:hypothetical protein JVT61DRAFT_8486 [Boletus reticuloceps]
MLHDSANMSVSGPESDAIASQWRRAGLSQGPSQDHLRVSGYAPYVVPSRFVSPLASSSSSRTSIWSSVDASESHGPKRRAPRGTHKNTIDATSLRWYPPNIQKVLTFARHALVNDMVNDLGWPHGETARTTYKTAMIEGIAQANDTFNEKVQLTYDMETLLLKEPTYVRSKAVEYAEEYAEKFFVMHDTGLLADQQSYQDWKIAQLESMSDHRRPSFFFHEHNTSGEVEHWFGSAILENFHCNFWYTTNISPIKHFASTYLMTPTRMYALSTTALLCASRRVAMGHKHSSRNALPFSGDVYGPIFDAYHTAVLEYVNHADIGPNVRARLDWLNAQGLQKMESAIPAPGTSSKKVAPVYVPPPRQAESHINIDSADTFLPQSESYHQRDNVSCYHSGEMFGFGGSTKLEFDL